MSHALIVYVDDELNGAAAEAGVVLAISPASRLLSSALPTLTSSYCSVNGFWM